MEIKIKNIVRIKGSSEVYEVINILGKVLLCKPINKNLDKAFVKYGMPIKADEVEVVMEEETDAFNLLFKRDHNEIE
jgi:hypothetical protein